MHGIKILVVEDDLTQADNIREILESSGYQVCGPAYDSVMAMEIFESNRPDLAFVDIKLDGSPMDGIQLVEQFRKKRNIPVIFLSDNYDPVTRERAKAVHPNHFLGKPYYPHQLDLSIDFAMHDFLTREGYLELSGNSYSPTARDPEFIFVKHNARYVRINVNDILYMEADGGATHIFLSRRSYLVSTSLSNFVKKLNNSRFVITHRSYAVNLYAVESFDADDVYLTRDLKQVAIPIAAARRPVFLNKIRIIKTK